MSQFLPAKVNVVLAVSKEDVAKNITENLNTIPVWYSRLFYPNGYEAIIVSGGPSLEKYVKEINLKERMVLPNRSFVVFCVKHALPRLLAMGIEPDFCVILDGRDFDAKSTHGTVRKELFKKIPEKTIFLVASMSNPGYAKYLLENGARVMGWHTQVTGIEDFAHLIKEPIVNGGTSSGTRCISLAYNLGMRDITLVGFDSCIHNPTEEDLKQKDEKGRQKYISINLPTNPILTPSQKALIDELSTQYKEQGLVYQSSLAKTFWTTGELMAQAQDFEGIFKNPQLDMQFKVLDDGLVHHMFNNMGNRPKRDFSFIEYFRNAVPKKTFSDVSKRQVVQGQKRTPKSGKSK